MNERTETMNPAVASKRNEVLPNMSTIGKSSWGAIFCGGVIALIISVTLGFLGAGIGLSTISSSPTAGTLQGVGIGAGIWSAIVNIVAMFFGGWVAARFAGMQRSFDGALHGLITWGLTSMVMLFLLTSAIGAAIGGGMGVLSGITRNSAQVYSALPPQARQQVQGAVQQGQQQLQQQAQQQSPQQLQQQARNIGSQAAKVTSGAAWGGFILLLLGGISAAIGGSVGRIRGTVRV